VLLPDPGELSRVAGRVQVAGVDADTGDDGLLVADPSGNRVLLTVG